MDQHFQFLQPILLKDVNTENEANIQSEYFKAFYDAIRSDKGQSAKSLINDLGEASTNIDYLESESQTFFPMATQFEETGWTAAHVAAFEGQYDILKHLIENKAAEVQDNRKWTPFYFAVAKGDITIARLLCENGANINQPGMVTMQNGKVKNLTPLEYAIFNKNLQMTAFLIKHGAKFDKNSTNHLMPVAIQALNESDTIEERLKSLDIICLLIEVGAFTGTNSKADLLNQIQEPDARRYAKEKREMYQLESSRLLKNQIPNSMPFSVPIRRFLRTRFILQGWHPYLVALCQLFQTKLSQLPSSHPTSDKFLQAIVQFQLISYLNNELGYYAPKKSLGSSIPAAFRKRPDINNRELYKQAIDLLYRKYLCGSQKVEPHKKEAVILERLERCTLKQINKRYIAQWNRALQYYMVKQGNSAYHYRRDIERVYDNTNPELQNELMRGFLGGY